MNNIHTLLFVALFAAGCSGTTTQAQPQTAADAVAGQAASDQASSEQDDSSEPADETASDPADAEEAAAQASAEGEAQVEQAAGPTVSAAPIAALLGASWADVENSRVYNAAVELGGFGDSTVVPLAHLRSGDRNVVIAWPALNAQGALSGSAVYGVCVEDEGDGTFSSCADRWVVNEAISARNALEAALGGTDYEVVSDQSTASLAGLGAQLTERANAFVSAASSGDREALFRAAQEVTGLLPSEELAFNNELVDLFVTAARNQQEFSMYRTEEGDLLGTTTIKVEDELRDRLVSLTSQRVDGTNQWRLVDFW